jgi:hypothetical protein
MAGFEVTPYGDPTVGRFPLGVTPSGRCEEIGKNGPDKGLSLVGGYG